MIWKNGKQLKVTLSGKGPTTLNYDLQIGVSQGEVAVKFVSASVTVCMSCTSLPGKDGSDGKTFLARTARHRRPAGREEVSRCASAPVSQFRLSWRTGALRTGEPAHWPTGARRARPRLPRFSHPATTARMIVEARGVTKHFGARVAVDGIDLDVPAGDCFGLLGPNGAGKTTTLRMLYGVCRPTAGTIHVFGIDIAAEPRAVRRRLGVTLQENVQIEALSPVDNLRVFGRYHLLAEPALGRRIDELIDFLELRSHADVPCSACPAASSGASRSPCR